LPPTEKFGKNHCSRKLYLCLSCTLGGISFAYPISGNMTGT
jgi:hypothetical protein